MLIKRQHYIPRALLEHFTNSDCRFFEVLVNSKKVYPSNPGDSMCESFTYEDDKLKPNTVENYFAKIDGEIASAVKDLIEIIEDCKMNKKDFSEVIKVVENLLPTFIMFYYRSGALLTEFSSIDKKDKIPLLTNKILNHQYITSLAKMIGTHYQFAIIESDNGFLLSDQFVSTAALKIKTRFWDISNRHMGLRETVILIPISSKYYLIYWHTENSFFVKNGMINTLNSDLLKAINRVIINNSYTKSIAEKQETIQDIIDDFEFASPTQIFAGGNPDGYYMGAIKKKEVFFHKKDQEAFEMMEFAGFKRFSDLGRNDTCTCGSGKKFKKCHEDLYLIIKPIINSFGEQRHYDTISGIDVIELPVDRWSGYKS